MTRIECQLAGGARGGASNIRPSAVPMDHLRRPFERIGQDADLGPGSAIATIARTVWPILVGARVGVESTASTLQGVY